MYALSNDERGRERTMEDKVNEREQRRSIATRVCPGGDRLASCPESSTLVIDGSRREHWWETCGGE